jgi:hypothetical protein
MNPRAVKKTPGWKLKIRDSGQGLRYPANIL